MKHSINIENLKCGGCANTIVKGLTALGGVTQVEVDHDQSAVRFMADPQHLAAVKEKLAAMGYPEQGSVTGFTAGLATAKSFVSCAIGRVQS
ncbi:MAG: hypothetical protein RL133_520 [Pseudomonadota bacterium]